MLTQTKVLGISEKQRIKLDIFVSFQKRNIFLHLKTIFFFDFILQLLQECDTFVSNSVFFFVTCSLQPTYSCFMSLKAISDGDLQNILQPL